MHSTNSQVVRSLGIDTYNENIIFMRADCHICKSEGFVAQTRLVVHYEDRSIVATLNVVHSDILKINEAALSEVAFHKLGVRPGDLIWVSHLKPIASLSDVRAKMYHRKIGPQAFQQIIQDVAAGLYSDIEIAAFISACAGDNMDLEEITWLTLAMVHTGSRLDWEEQVILDKHCIGGLPGNRTTPIVVSIVAAAGLTIPKTSSRAITSPAGTADTMEVITRVNLTMEEMKNVVTSEGGCIAWGGSMKLSPADDILIAVERALDVESYGQMIASVLSKKAAAGSTHVVIDIPVGPTAKVRQHQDALKLQYFFQGVGDALGMHVEVLITDGTQPVGRGMGPALEARDVLDVLRNEADAPWDLKQKSETIAGTLLEMASYCPKGSGPEKAREILESGQAYLKFERICKAQGAFREPPVAKYKKEICAEMAGTVLEIDNRKLAKVAKLAGAPKSPAAGLYFQAPIGTKVEKGQCLFVIHAEEEGELKYANEFLMASNHIVRLE
ncbi:MAG TPA: thymidine phosphorylase family protein [Saprospiraceae bacterium]|nr:thymidine phosphorylase family protein [Saprospiraceae bacterium]